MQRLKAAMSLPSCLPDLTEGEVQKAKPQKRRATKVLRNTSSKKQKNLFGKLPNIDFPLVLPGQELSPTIAEVTRLGTYTVQASARLSLVEIFLEWGLPLKLRKI